MKLEALIPVAISLAALAVSIVSIVRVVLLSSPKLVIGPFPATETLLGFFDARNIVFIVRVLVLNPKQNTNTIVSIKCRWPYFAECQLGSGKQNSNVYVLNDMEYDGGRMAELLTGRRIGDGLP